MQLKFKDNKLCAVTRFFAAASSGQSALTFLKIAGGIEKDFGKEQIIKGAKENKTAYYAWKGKYCIVVLAVDLNPVDIPDANTKLYRIFFTVSPIE